MNDLDAGFGGSSGEHDLPPGFDNTHSPMSQGFGYSPMNNDQYPGDPGNMDLPQGFGQFTDDPFGFFCPGLKQVNLNEETEWQQSNNHTPGKSSERHLVSGLLEVKGLEDLNNFFEKDISKKNFNDKENDNPVFDQVSDEKDWQNWSIATFTPKGCDEQGRIKARAIVAGGPAVEVSSSMSTMLTYSKGLNKIINQCSVNGSLFEDMQFRANIKSLQGTGERPARSDFKSYVWKRPYDIFNGPYDVCSRRSVGPNDLQQGSLGDCYFIASVAAVAEVPERVAKNILSKDPNPCGAHSVTLCITGIWEDIVIDDLFPTDDYRQKPAFSHSRTQDIWIMLLEKAWAKVNGGYMDIEAGFLSEALIALTGAPCHTFFIPQGDSEENWRVILEGEKKNFIMACASGDFNKSGNDAADSSSGLSGNHAYSLLSAHEIEHNGRTERLVKLRNPWGKGEWKGDWSDESPLWTPQLKSQLNLNDDDDGIFFMTFKEWQKYFHDFDVCYYHDNYLHSAKKFTSSATAPTVIKFNVSAGGEYYFILSQVNSRMFRKTDRYSYSGCSLIVARVEGGDFEHMGTVAKADQQIWFKANCRPGQYIAYIETPWKRNVNQFTFGIYSPELITFSSSDPGSVADNFVQKMLMDKAKKDTSMLKSYANNGAPEIRYRFETSSDSYSYFYFNNQSSDTTLKATVQLVDSLGIELLPPHTGSRNPEVTVRPGEENIVVCKMVSNQAKLSVRVAAAFTKSAPRTGGGGAAFGGGFKNQGGTGTGIGGGTGIGTGIGGGTGIGYGGQSAGAGGYGGFGGSPSYGGGQPYGGGLFGGPSYGGGSYADANNSYGGSYGARQYRRYRAMGAEGDNQQGGQYGQPQGGQYQGQGFNQGGHQGFGGGFGGGF